MKSQHFPSSPHDLASFTRHQALGIQHTGHIFQHPASRNQHPASSVHHPSYLTHHLFHRMCKYAQEVDSLEGQASTQTNKNMLINRSSGAESDSRIKISGHLLSEMRRILKSIRSDWSWANRRGCWQRAKPLGFWEQGVMELQTESSKPQ